MSRSNNRDKSFFEQGFDSVTLTKLDIFSRYLQEWLPVPLSGRMRVREAVVYDLGKPKISGPVKLLGFSVAD